jgi:hypothetical protein
MAGGATRFRRIFFFDHDSRDKGDVGGCAPFADGPRSERPSPMAVLFIHQTVGGKKARPAIGPRSCGLSGARRGFRR